jgi:hypothetical protein
MAACATGDRGFVVPSGTGSPAPEAAQVLAAALAGCNDTQSITAEASLSGKVGGRRARGRLIVGSTSDGRLRIEAVASFGAPVFVLAADGVSTTLLLPRDERVLTGAPVADVLDAVAGLRLEAGDLHAMLTGCGVEAGEIVGASRHGRSLLAVHLGGDTVWIREHPEPARVLAAEVGSVIVEYPDASAVPPPRIRLKVKPGTAGAPGTDVTLRLSEVETNVSLSSEAFMVRVPPDARPMSLTELRQTGLLGGS